MRRGSKGIALLDTSGEKPRLRYVFDISDTGEYGKIPAVHFFGNFSRNMKRRWLKFWSRDLACLWKIIWLSSSRVLQTSLSVSIGRNTSGIFVTSLTEGYQEGEDRKNLHTSGGEEQAKYLSAYHELAASAWATRLAREIDPKNKVGCMMAAGNHYPYCFMPEDVWAVLGKDGGLHRLQLLLLPLHHHPGKCRGDERKRLQSSGTFTRYRKKSFDWYRKVIASNGEEL